MWLGAVVVAEKNLGLVGERADDRDLDAGGLERQDAVVFEQDHGFVGDFAGECAMGSAVEEFLVDGGVGDHLRRIEHAEFDARGEESGEGGVDVAFLADSLA